MQVTLECEYGGELVRCTGFTLYGTASEERDACNASGTVILFWFSFLNSLLNFYEQEIIDTGGNHMDTESNLAVKNLLLLLDDIERKCFKASVEYVYGDKFHFPSEVDSFHTKMNSKFAIIKSLKNTINTLFLTEPTDTPMEIINGVKEVLIEISDAIH